MIKKISAILFCLSIVAIIGILFIAPTQVYLFYIGVVLCGISGITFCVEKIKELY